MPVEKIRLGTNEDGSPHYLYRAVNEDGTPKPDAHLVFTGANTSGEVELSDGTQVNITDLFVVADSPAQALEISDAIGAKFQAEGHPAHDAEAPFVATPSALTHNEDGTAKPEFVQAVEAAIPFGQDSRPQAVVDALVPTTTPEA